MKELKTHSDWDWNAWFWVDKEEFEGGWKIGQCRYRVEKAVGRDTDGKLFLMAWTNLDKNDWHKFTQFFYEINVDEYTALLDRAISQGEVKPEEREHLINKAKSPFIPPWDIHKAIVVYHDDSYTLGQKHGRPYLIANGKRYVLACHPYEPCLYITDESGTMTAVHNAFNPFDVLDSFNSGDTITSITGFEYDAKDFCRMVEHVAGMKDIGIDDAEKIFGDRQKQKNSKPKKQSPERSLKDPSEQYPNDIHDEFECCSQTHQDLKDDVDRYPNDPFYEMIAKHPDCVIDYCIVKNYLPYVSYPSHWTALLFACKKIFIDDQEDLPWHYDIEKAKAKQITTDELFAPMVENGRLCYQKAFLKPPHGTSCTYADFEQINSVLFPNGTNRLETYEWTTDWSDYFDDGHEWWGSLCLTVYDKSLDRFVVILASATD